ncbi:MAG: DNA-directed RNA polymerase subunit omega [Phycisphaerae bacterium]|nr:DNA-directed RNA polymerase subunit omega [Phycisphaerae bacterium]
MIEQLKNDDIIRRFGGRFKLTAVIQKRWRDLMHGARPMVEDEGLTQLEVAIKEIAEGKIDISDTPHVSASVPVVKTSSYEDD